MLSCILQVNGTKLYATKGIGNGTGIPASNPTGMYQALQGVFFPQDQASWRPPYIAFLGNPVTRAGPPPAGNTYAKGGAENCEFAAGPDGHFHAVCASHGALYPGAGTALGGFHPACAHAGLMRRLPCCGVSPASRRDGDAALGWRRDPQIPEDAHLSMCAARTPTPCPLFCVSLLYVACASPLAGGYAPHYLVTVRAGPAPEVRWQFVGFVSDLGASEPTPVYEGVPGDAAAVRYFVARRAGGVALYSVAWSPIHHASRAAGP